jgi:hypothetical protein
MFVSGITGSWWKSYRLENFASDFCLQLLAEIGTDPGCLIVIELASPCQITAETLLKEDQYRKVDLLALEIHFVHNDSGTVDGSPSSRDSPTSLALSPSTCLALELQFGRLRRGEESIAASRWNFPTPDLADLSLCKCLVNFDLLEKPCTTEPEGSEPLWVLF